MYTQYIGKHTLKMQENFKLRINLLAFKYKLGYAYIGS